MRGEIKESRLAYKSEWLEVYEDLLSIDAQPVKRGERIAFISTTTKTQTMSNCSINKAKKR